MSKAGGEGTARTLREAINRAGEGWTIAIAEPRLSEPALVLKDSKYKDLTIESATPDGKPAVIEYAGVKGGTVLDLSTVEGLRLRNVEFDGKGSAEVGVQVSGVCPGTTLEGVTIRGVQKLLASEKPVRAAPKSSAEAFRAIRAVLVRALEEDA